MDIEFLLNHALNKALCSKGRIKRPNSNEIAEFVTKYIEFEKLTLTSVSLPKVKLCNCKGTCDELSDLGKKIYVCQCLPE